MRGGKQLENEKYVYVKYHQKQKAEYIFVHFWRSLFLLWSFPLHFMFF